MDDIDQNMPNQAELKSKPIWKLLPQKERANEAQKPHTGRGGMKVKAEGRRGLWMRKEPAS